MQGHILHISSIHKTQKVLTIAITGLVFVAVLLSSGGFVSAAGSSVTIYPGNWQSKKQAKIVNDGSHGKVVRIRPTNDSMASGVFSSGKATATYPNGKPLGKLANFVKANYGKPARMCVTARANNAYGTIALSANNFVSKQSDGTYFKSKYFDATKNYKKYCINFKIISQKAYEANNGEFYTPAEVWVQNVTYDSTIFIDNVKISLR